MSDRSLKNRLCACALAVAISASGCARPVALHPQEETVGEIPGEGFVSPPYIVTDEEPLRVIGLSSSDKEAFVIKERERGRRESVEFYRQKEYERAVPLCVLGTFIILSPLCLLIVPPIVAIEARRKAGHGAAEGPPTESELRSVDEKISAAFTAAGVVRRLPGQIAHQRVHASGTLPRLVIRADAASFASERRIAVSVIAHGRPSSGTAWRPTEHRYSFSYGDDWATLESGLAEAEKRIAHSIASAYRLR